MVAEAFFELLIALLSFIATTCDCGCIRLTDRLAARSDSRMADRLIEQSANRAAIRARKRA